MENNKILKRTLGLTDLTAMGIAAIVGAGIYSTIGIAASTGGVGVIFLFILTALACLCSALCYAEFASSLAVSGSAYSYAKQAFGNLVAWVIGWDLVMEYAIGNTAVAISWSDYLSSFLDALGIHIPDYLTMDYRSAASASIINASADAHKAYLAFQHAPQIMGLKIVFDLPAVFINLLITLIVIWGIRESKWANHLMVVFKLMVVALVVSVGFFYVNTENWNPIAPFGMAGIMKGASAVFFAYIGFDAISTTSEECIHPQRDIPKAIIYALVICTVIYILVALVITGMLPYYQLSVGDPLALVFERNHLGFLSGLIGVSAIVSLASVMLVYQIGQPRIWMSMSRDGMLPRIFSDIHPKFKTPWFATLVTGILVALPLFFLNLSEVADLCSIGTLFAFCIVCAGVAIKPRKSATTENFKVYFINGKFLTALTSLFLIGYIFVQNPTIFNQFRLELFPTYILILCLLLLSFLSYSNSYSYIPSLGIIINLYLMSEMGYTNWLRFGIWLVIGLVVYFAYSRKNVRKANALSQQIK